MWIHNDLNFYLRVENYGGMNLYMSSERLNVKGYWCIVPKWILSSPLTLHNNFYGEVMGTRLKNSFFSVIVYT